MLALILSLVATIVLSFVAAKFLAKKEPKMNVVTLRTDRPTQSIVSGHYTFEDRFEGLKLFALNLSNSPVVQLTFVTVKSLIISGKGVVEYLCLDSCLEATTEFRFADVVVIRELVPEFANEIVCNTLRLVNLKEDIDWGKLAQLKFKNLIFEGCAIKSCYLTKLKADVSVRFIDCCERIAPRAALFGTSGKDVEDMKTLLNQHKDSGIVKALEKAIGPSKLAETLKSYEDDARTELLAELAKLVKA